jgi:hypothetical protein
MGSLCQGRYGWFQRKLEADTRRGGKRQVIFAATAEHSMWPVDAKAPEPRPNWAPASIAKAPTRSVWRQPSSPEPSGSNRLASISRAPSSVPGGQLSSQDANAISIIIQGIEVGFLRVRFFIPNQGRTRQDSKPPTALPDTTFTALEAPAGQDTPR